MKIYLVRHTTPLVEKGICYGHSDIDITTNFEEEASIIGRHLPGNIEMVYTSPLRRCLKLACLLFPSTTIHTCDSLRELNFGDWEMQNWDAIPQSELQPWMRDFVSVPTPNGESYEQLNQRVVAQFETIKQATQNSSAIITHGGVIRSILSYVTNTPLKDSFEKFSIQYGCVIELDITQSMYRWQFLT